MKLKPSLSWLLVFVPITVALHYLRPAAHLWIFIAACTAIIPLAGWMGRATEHLAEHTGEGVLFYFLPESAGHVQPPPAAAPIPTLVPAGPAAGH